MSPQLLLFLSVLAGLFAVSCVGAIGVLVGAVRAWATARRARRTRIALLEARYDARRALRTHSGELDGLSLEHAADFFTPHQHLDRARA